MGHEGTSRAENSHIDISQGTLTDLIPGKWSSQIIPTCFYKQVARVKTFYIFGSNGYHIIGALDFNLKLN